MKSTGRWMAVGAIAASAVLALAPGASSAIGEERAPLNRLPQVRNFSLVGSNPLANPPGSRMSASGLPRGMNAALGAAKSCAYVGSRNGLQDILIVDISDPAHPEVVGNIPGIPLSSSRELKAIEDLDMLVVGHFALDAGGATGENPTAVPGVVNNFRIYNIADCTRPVLRSEFDLGGGVWHEFFLWRDPRNPRRVLAYISFIGGEAVPDLRVWDLTDAQNGVQPRQVASFTLDPAVPASERVDPAAWDPAHFPFRATDLSDRIHARFLFASRFGPQPPSTVSNLLHSMSVSDDGTRVYMANLNAGFFILDSSNLADESRARTCVPDTVTRDATTNRNPNLCLRKLNPDPAARLDWHPPQPNITHTAVKVPGRPLVLVGDERNGTTTCPWAWYRIVDISSEADPKIIAGSEMLLPENRPENCRLGGPGDPKHLREFSSHNMTPFRNIGFVTWYSGGLRAWDYSDPSAPREVGVFVPRPHARVQFPFRDSPDVWAWSYPVVRNGLIYFVDMRNGLYVVRYTGPRSDEVPARGVYSGDMSPPPAR